jgi:S1-C subfamily serine protease
MFLKVDGINVKEEGLILTNAHVITNSPVVKIMTTYIEHQALPVTVVSLSHDRDLALLKVEPAIMQWLKRTLSTRYGLDHIPALSFADSDTLRVGMKVHACGHPLGIVDQQFTTGDYQGVVHMQNEIRGLSGATINGGNSGGPLLSNTIQEEGIEEKSYPGIHYFEPSRYELIGVNTFKLTGANVEGENGFIHSNTVKLALPVLMEPLEHRYEQEKAAQAMVTQMSLGVNSPSQSLLLALHDHLSAGERECLLSEELQTSFEKYELGGCVRNKPRSMQEWIHRHVFAQEENCMQRGGPELLAKFLSFASNNDWDGLCDWSDNKRWQEVKEEVTSTKTPETMPLVVRMLPPPASHKHSPQIGITSHPIFTPDILVHYKCPQNEEGRFAATGGAFVSQVTPNSLYELAGGLPGDIIYKFENEKVVAELSEGGTWYSAQRDLPLSLSDLCNDTRIDEDITMHVLRQKAGLMKIILQNRAPTYAELPHVRQTYSFCDEGMFEAKQKAQVCGIQFAPLRLQHVQAFRLMDYACPKKQHQFKVVVEAVSPASPAYASEALHPGMVVTHINDEPIALSWNGVLQQMAKPHEETNCWVLQTEFQGQTSKFVMVCRKTIAK